MYCLSSNSFRKFLKVIHDSKVLNQDDLIKLLINKFLDFNIETKIIICSLSINLV